ncbi:TnsD family Tn7-like transposition protein [Neobacillus sp. PS2-9]|uniref:TnsD family Tn7-like transposition protein n=1 Tax=Neobacillus sp. PS2-9 TaxID=3070676 RepID=UPI0027E0AAB3|nr:TnsD family Tn7-like transposition protein [Neobacillus sp. PS2-9]WML58113.1 TnsD family Tn7-like transposition protein [Neobacillus sp. PS2-9]
MIVYFPFPYKGETIYSIIARYSRHIGVGSRYFVQKEFFNNKRIEIDFEYITYIKRLSEKIHHFSKEYTIDYFFKSHTTLPFYLPFEDTGTSIEMIRGSTMRKQRIIEEVNVPQKEHLYYCASCLKDQLKRYGEGYWDRLFQIPGVFVCPRHLEVLMMSSVNNNRQSVNRFEFPENCVPNSTINKVDEEVIKELSIITKNIEYFLDHSPKAIGTENLYVKYLEFIKIAGLSIPLSKIKGNLYDLIHQKFKQETLMLLNSQPKQHNWLKDFSEKGIKKIHPVRQVLLMISLAGSVQEFIESSPEFKPFGKGPWVCMNPLSDHYLQNVVKNIEISVHLVNRDYQGDFICHCGYVYRLRIGEKEPVEVQYFSNRVMKKGHVWEKEFKRLIQTGISLQELSKKTKLSVMTLRKIIKEGPDPIINGIKCKAEKITKARIDKTKNYRIIWKKLREDNPNFTRTEIASLNRGVFSWLHIYDQEWLFANSPDSKKGIKPKAKGESDIYEEDLKLLRRAKFANKKWKKYEEIAGKQLRKSHHAFSRQCGHYRIDERYPKTLFFLKKIVESAVDFQKRKLEKTLKELFEDTPVSRFKLLEVTGIRKTLKKEVIPYLDELLKEHYKKLCQSYDK